MVKVWLMDNDTNEPRLEHHRNPPVYVEVDELFKKTGVECFQINADDFQNDKVLQDLRQTRNYSYEDTGPCSDKCFPGAMMKMFFSEHLHTDEEIRLVLDGSCYFDVRDAEENWIRISATKGDLIVIPAGIYHRFTLDTNAYLNANRYFVGEPDWQCYDRPCDEMDCRKEYLKHQLDNFEKL